MTLEFDIGQIATTEFGSGRQKPTGFFFVPVDANVKWELQAMVQRTISRMKPEVANAGYYQPSEKYEACEYCYLNVQDPLAGVFRDVAMAENLSTDSAFLVDLANVTCYFVRLTDQEGRRLTAFRRAAHFKGVVKKKLLHLVDDTLRLVGDTVFKLDADFDLLVDARAVHVLRPRSWKRWGISRRSS